MLIQKSELERKLPQYIELLTDSGYAEHTIRCYQSRLSQFYSFLSENQFSAVDMEIAIEQYCSILKQERYANSSLNNLLSTIEHFLKFATNQKLRFARFEAEESKERILMPDEQRRFNESVMMLRSARDRAILLLMFETGIRIKQVVSLNVDQLQIEANSSVIRILTIGQSKFPEKTLLFKVSDCLKAALNDCLLERENVTSNYEPAFFINKYGRRLSAGGVAYIIKRIGWKMRIEMTARSLCFSKSSSGQMDLPQVLAKAYVAEISNLALSSESEYMSALA